MAEEIGFAVKEKVVLGNYCKGYEMVTVSMNYIVHIVVSYCNHLNRIINLFIHIIRLNRIIDLEDYISQLIHIINYWHQIHWNHTFMITRIHLGYYANFVDY